MSKNFVEIQAEVETGMGGIAAEAPDVMTSFMGLHQAVTADGALSKRTKELMALAIAITVRCDGCIAFHVKDALEAGATRGEIVGPDSYGAGLHDPCRSVRVFTPHCRVHSSRGPISNSSEIVRSDLISFSTRFSTSG